MLLQSGMSDLREALTASGITVLDLQVQDVGVILDVLVFDQTSSWFDEHICRAVEATLESSGIHGGLPRSGTCGFLSLAFCVLLRSRRLSPFTVACLADTIAHLRDPDVIAPALTEVARWVAGARREGTAANWMSGPEVSGFLKAMRETAPADASAAPITFLRNVQVGRELWQSVDESAFDSDPAEAAFVAEDRPFRSDGSPCIADAGDGTLMCTGASLGVFVESPAGIQPVADWCPSCSGPIIADFVGHYAVYVPGLMEDGRPCVVLFDTVEDRENELVPRPQAATILSRFITTLPPK